ncbi:MAG: hypothetical protein HC909_00695 [Blastochloris sp.]|nr:hypothetical protein [Blastochloris sp.]
MMGANGLDPVGEALALDMADHRVGGLGQHGHVQRRTRRRCDEDVSQGRNRRADAVSVVDPGPRRCRLIDGPDPGKQLVPAAGTRQHIGRTDRIGADDLYPFRPICEGEHRPAARPHLQPTPEAIDVVVVAQIGINYCK